MTAGSRSAPRRPSLLDRAISRTEGQRALLDRLAAMAPGIGPVLELGLGNGRTFDHLRERLPGREMFAFDRAITAAPASLPDAAHVVFGDLRDTLPHVAERIGAPAALIHADLSSGDPTLDLSVAHWLARLAPPLLGPGGLLASSIPLRCDALEPPDLSEAATAGYSVHRR